MPKKTEGQCAGCKKPIEGGALHWPDKKLYHLGCQPDVAKYYRSPASSGPLPCPCCGAEAELKHREWMNQYLVKCSGCGLSTATKAGIDAGDRVTALWNARAK